MVQVTLLSVVFSAGGGTFAAVLTSPPPPPPPALVQALLPLVERSLFLVQPGAAVLDVLGSGRWLDGPLRAIGVPDPVAEWAAVLPMTAINVVLMAGVLGGIAWGGPTLVAYAWRRRTAAV